MTVPKSKNVSDVRDPKWTGGEGEWAIAVSRGEPRRSDIQMEVAVAGQARRYLSKYDGLDMGDVNIAFAARLIAVDHIEPEGKQGVQLTNTHLRAYVDEARKRLTAAAEHDAQNH